LVSKRLDIVRGQGLIRFKNGEYDSWLEATPTIFLSSLIPFVYFHKKFVGAASCRDK
jgi:hypothetical protein